MKKALTRRRGLTSLLAMIYLMLFSTLAIGFYAATTTQTQIVANDERVARAFVACESGMDFMRYQLGRVYIPSDVSGSDVLPRLYDELQTLLDETPNLGPDSVSMSGNTISIPGNGGYIPLDSTGNARFRAIITDWLGEIVVKIDGQHGSTGSLRAISMDFSRAARPMTAFDYAVASKGKITMTSGMIYSTAGVDPAIATAMSALESGESVFVSGGTIGGDIYVTGSGVANVTGGSVGGSTITSVIMENHVHWTETPEFPIFDTEAFRAFATNVYEPAAMGNRVFTNILIPAGLGTAANPVRFEGNSTLQGIMFIESPNVVEIKGTFNLNGFIVFEGAGDSTQNSLLVSGTMTQGPVPNSPEFDAVRATSGVAILAPTTKLTITGNAKGSVRGSIIAWQLWASGSNAEFIIDQGTLMTLDDGPNSAMFSGDKKFLFSSTGGGNLPTTGMSYSTYYLPNPISYQEIAP